MIRSKKKAVPAEMQRSGDSKLNNSDKSFSDSGDSGASVHLKLQKKRAQIQQYRLEGMKVDKFGEAQRSARDRIIKKMVSDNRFQISKFEHLFVTAKGKNRNKLAE